MGENPIRDASEMKMDTLKKVFSKVDTTYIIIAIMVIFVVLYSADVIDEKKFLTIMGVLTPMVGVTLKGNVKKVEKTLEHDRALRRRECQGEQEWTTKE